MSLGHLAQVSTVPHALVPHLPVSGGNLLSAAFVFLYNLLIFLSCSLIKSLLIPSFLSKVVCVCMYVSRVHICVYELSPHVLLQTSGGCSSLSPELFNLKKILSRNSFSHFVIISIPNKLLMNFQCVLVQKDCLPGMIQLLVHDHVEQSLKLHAEGVRMGRTSGFDGPRLKSLSPVILKLIANP